MSARLFLAVLRARLALAAAAPLLVPACCVVVGGVA